jgi:hypothetical protein
LRPAQGKSLQDSTSTNEKLGMVEYTCHPSHTGCIKRRIVVQIILGTNVRPYLKNNGSKQD